MTALAAGPRTVVVGAGLAGFRTARALRDNGHAGHLVVVGDEPHLPYDRPPLSKQLLAGRWSADQVALTGDTTDLDWRLGVAASRLDLSGRRVQLADGTSLSFDRLVIASGRRARPWPGDHPRGVFTLRSLEDVAHLVDATPPGSRVVIVGAGFIGCEVAATLRGREVEVTVVDVADHPMPVLGAVAGAAARALHESHGVTWRFGTGVAAFQGDAQVNGVLLDTGETLPADAVLVAIGSLPNTEWLDGAGLLLDRGAVVVDDTCTALDPAGEPVVDVLAVGDVAAWTHPYGIGPASTEHWSNAREMAACAAANLLLEAIERRPLRSLPSFWSDQYGVTIRSAGHLRAADELEVLDRDDARNVLLIEARSAGEVVGAIGFNVNKTIIGYQRDLRRAAAPAA